MKNLKYYIFGALGLGVIITLTVFYLQIRSYKTQIILAKIETSKLEVSQEKAIAALNNAHAAVIAAKDLEIEKQKALNAVSESEIAAVKVKDSKQIAALRASGATWEVKFDTLAGDYNVLLDKSGKQNGLIEGQKMVITGLESEVFTLKTQAVESSKLFETQKEAWKKQLASTLVKASRTIGVVIGPSAVFGVDAKMHYGAGVVVGWRIY